MASCISDGVSGPECAGECEGELRINALDWPALCEPTLDVLGVVLETCDTTGASLTWSPAADVDGDARGRAARLEGHLRRLALLADGRARRVAAGDDLVLDELIPAHRRDIEAATDGDLNLSSYIGLLCAFPLLDELQVRVEIQRGGLEQVVEVEASLRSALGGEGP